MAREKTLKVSIVGDADKLDRELRKSGNSLDKFGKQTRVTSSITSKGFAGMRVAAVGATAAVGGLAIAGKKVVEAAIESEKSQARLASQLKALDISYADHRDEIEKVIQKHSQLAGLDDEDLQDAFTAIVRTTGDVSKAMASMAVVTDLARAKNMDVAKAGEFVAKIHAGNVGGLRRLGLEFTKTTENVDKLKASNEDFTPKQLAMAKSLDQSANSAKALGLLQNTLKGQAEAYGKTTAGSVDRANVAFENLQETVGAAVAPTVEKAAGKLADFVNEMQDGTGQGGRFADKLKEIWQEAKPIVTWIGRATRNVAQFTAEHPGLAKLATGVLAVGAAVKALRFVSAATGFTALLKAGTSAGRLLRRRFIAAGAEAGAGAAASTAAGYAGGSAAIGTAASKTGKTAGKKFVSGLLLSVPLLIWEFKDAINQIGRDFSNSKIGRILTAPGKLGGKLADVVNGLLGRNTGGIIPGTGDRDTVPAMLTPGEFVIRKKVVEKFGPTFFAAINEGRAPQMRTSGGIIARANRLDSQRIPYLYGGGHGTKDGYNPGGMDCSASVSYALGISPRVSGALMSFGKPGAGSPNDTKIYANPEHVFAVFNGKGWGTSRENPGGGPGWLSYNHRPGFTIRHLEDGDASSSAASVGDPEETSEPGKMTKRERQERAGSRIVNRIVGRALRGASRQARAASAIGGVIEDAEGGFGRSERFFGQVKGGRPGDFGEEDLGTAQGRADRISELGELKKLKVAQLARMRKRAAALKRVIVKYERALKQMNAARGKAKGAKRAKISERMKSYDDRLTDYKAELRGLGESIADTQLDIGDLEKDIGEVAATPDTEPEAGPSVTDRVSQDLSDIDAKERAGLISAAEANAARQSVLGNAIAGGYGAITERERWDLMGQLRDVTGALAQATVDATAAIRELKASIDAHLAFADRVSAVTSMEAVRAMADVMSGQLGARVQQRGTMPGSGALSRL